MANIALFGGAFDPIHQGHLAAARHALMTFALDQVRFIPCASPVHKPCCQATPWQRAAMVALALNEEASLVLDTSELERSTPSYAIDTIEAFIDQHGTQHRLFWLLGDDALRAFQTWHRWPEIVRYVDLIAVSRESQSYDEAMMHPLTECLEQAGHRLHYLHMPLQPQASSYIRAHASFSGHVPPLVQRYIEAEKVYG